MPNDSGLDIGALVQIYQTSVVCHCICAVVRLGVPDELASGPLPLEVLADRVGAQKEPLQRVLRLLGDYHLFELSKEEITLTDFGGLLRKDHPTSAWSIFAGIGLPDVAYALEEALRTGQVAAERALGVPFWQYLAAHSDQQAIFDEFMRIRISSLAEMCIPRLRWPTSGTIVDVGGGTGTVLSAALRAAPGLKGILTDQEQVLPRARSLLADELAAGRCDVRGTDLFSAAPRGDIYLLSYVLHDWSDANALRILNAIGTQAPESARLRVFEYIVPENGQAHVSKFSDVAMLLMLGEGHERTESEFRALFDQAGWRVEEITAWGETNLIEASPASNSPVAR